MYYFKVPVFTKLSRIQNIIVLSLQIFILIISILISLYRGCNYESSDFIDGCSEFNILPGDTMITNRSYTSWLFLKPKKYSSELIPEIYDIKYYNKKNTTFNNYLLFIGNIMIFEKNTKNYNAIFKGFSDKMYYEEFIADFNKYVDMNKEIYKIDIKDGFLELLFLNNCSNNSVLFEKDEECYFKNYTIENINYYLNDYFNQIFITRYSCHSCYERKIKSLDEFITVLSKCISIFLMFNSFFIVIYIFIASKIKKYEIGYINDLYKKYLINYKDLNSEDINIYENIKIEKKV